MSAKEMPLARSDARKAQAARMLLTSRADAEVDTPVAVGWRIRIEGDSFAILPPGGEAVSGLDCTQCGEPVDSDTALVMTLGVRVMWRDHTALTASIATPIEGQESLFGGDG